MAWSVEDDLKISIVEYLSNHRSDLSQILNSSHETNILKMKMTSYGGRPNWQTKYLRNH